MSNHSSRISAKILGILAPVLALTFLVTPVGAHGEERVQKDPEPASLVKVQVADRTELDRLIATGVDLTSALDETSTGYVITAVLTPSQVQMLRSKGFRVGAAAHSLQQLNALRAERELALSAEPKAVAPQSLGESETGAVKVLRADYFQGSDGEFLSVEAKSAAGAADMITVAWDDGPGTGLVHNIELFAFVDDDVYLYHRRQFPVGTRPELVETTSTDTGESVTLSPTEWLPLSAHEPGPAGPRYRIDFVDHYMDPTELTQRIEQLAAEFFELAEIIELPILTNGYRRQAQAVLGTTPSNSVVVTSDAWGHEGGNDLTVSFVDPGTPDHPLTVTVTDDNIDLISATNSAGDAVTTAADAVAALNAGAWTLIDAHTYRGDAGSGVILPDLFIDVSKPERNAIGREDLSFI
jgi:hypothetical protein